MGYRDDFYIVDNIIGYTGTIQSDATVYFEKGNEFGHITQNHPIKVNIGREGVGSDPNYSIGNELIDGKLFCVERTGPNEDDIFHVSRNTFVSVAGLPSLHLNLLARAILNFPDQKAMYGMTSVELKRAIEGDPIQGLNVHRYIKHHERLISLASR